MAKTYVKYGAILIGLYLGVYYATGAGKVLEGATHGGATVIKAFQGR